MATRSIGRGNEKKNNNSHEGTSVSVISSSIPTSFGPLHNTQGGDDGEDLDKEVDLILVCELHEVTMKRIY